MEYRHPLCHLERNIHVVLDEQDRHLGLQCQEKRGELLSLTGGETGSGLVEEQQLRPTCERHPELELPLFPVRERTSQRVQGMPETNPFCETLDFHTLGILGPRSAQAESPRLNASDGEVEIIGDAETRKNERGLVGTR